MASWRFLGKSSTTRKDPRTETLILHGVSPWSQTWSGGREKIVVPNPDNPSRFHHVGVYWIYVDGNAMTFAAGMIFDSSYAFFIPCSIETDGAFQAGVPRREGYWKASPEEDSGLPWPEPQPGWDKRNTFLDALEKVEATAERVAYRGVSMCRLCRRPNGNAAFWSSVWEWPSGFRHYVADHNVRPSTDFESFIFLTLDRGK